MERNRTQRNSACLAARPLQRALRIGTGLLLVLALSLLAGCLAEEGEPAKAAGSLSFAADVQPALTKAGCYGCHGVTPLTQTECSDGCHGGTNRTGTSMTTLTIANMVGGASYTTNPSDFIVSPGSSANSTLWWVVSGDTQYTTKGGSMLTLMGTNKLGAADAATIKAWIDGGAKP